MQEKVQIARDYLGTLLLQSEATQSLDAALKSAKQPISNGNRGDVPGKSSPVWTSLKDRIDHLDSSIRELENTGLQGHHAKRVLVEMNAQLNAAEQSWILDKELNKDSLTPAIIKVLDLA